MNLTASDISDSNGIHQVILNALSAHIAVIDESGRIVAVNDAWRKFAHENAHENDNGGGLAGDIGANYFSVCRAAYAEACDAQALAVVDGLKAVLSGDKKPFVMEYRCDTPAGIRWFRMEAYPFVAERQLCLIAHQDITDRTTAQELLRQSEEKHRLLIENAGEAIFVAQEDQLKFVNPQCSAILGYPRAELLTGPFARFIHPDDRGMVMDLHLRRQQGNPGPSRYAFRVQTRSGTLRWLELNVVPIQWEGRAATLNFANDITLRREMAAEKEALQVQLVQSQKMESIGRLAGGIAHDLNNLLSPILGYGELVLDDFGEDDPRRDKVAQMIRAGNRARDLVKQLLAFSRKQTLAFKALDLNRTVAAFADLLRRTIREDIDLAVSLHDRPLMVMADRGQLEQVIMNLAVNAADAMPNGGRLSIATNAVVEDAEQSAVQGLETPTERKVALIVSDTGAGMDAATRANIFEPFFSTKAEQGTGLGLATVYGIVKQHGGQIRLKSAPGKGTTFSVHLPAIDAIPSELPAEIDPADDLEGWETILLVEDNAVVRDVARLILVRHGYTVLVADAGLAALSLLENHPGPVHLLLTDVIMPDLNGLELYHAAVEKCPNLNVLFMSGYADDVLSGHRASDARRDFIQKPFSPKDLAKKVRQRLNASAEARNA